MNYLFLDCDGVLNSEGLYMLDHDHPDVLWSRFEQLSRSSLQVLKNIVDKYDFLIILSSCWRYGWGLGVATDHQKILTFALGLYGMEVEDTTPEFRREMKRGYEIATWIKEYKGKIDKILILDNDSDMLNLTPYLCQTSWKYGLLESHMSKVDSIMKNQKDGEATDLAWVVGVTVAH